MALRVHLTYREFYGLPFASGREIVDIALVGHWLVAHAELVILPSPLIRMEIFMFDAMAVGGRLQRMEVNPPLLARETVPVNLPWPSGVRIS